MPPENKSRTAADERLSALADGELDESFVAGGCADWRSDAQARATWHAYHLIGDVLRSTDLADDTANDAAFLQALRGRLANEPVVLAPTSPPRLAVDDGLASAGASRRGVRWGWIAPSAVAAGFVAVAGVLVVTRSADAPANSAVAVASLPLAIKATGGVPMAVASSLTASAVGAADPLALVASGDFIRDARLDRYLAAHKQFAGSSALGVPSGFLRNATVDATQR